MKLTIFSDPVKFSAPFSLHGEKIPVLQPFLRIPELNAGAIEEEQKIIDFDLFFIRLS